MLNSVSERAHSPEDVKRGRLSLTSDCGCSLIRRQGAYSGRTVDGPDANVHALCFGVFRPAAAWLVGMSTIGLLALQ